MTLLRFSQLSVDGQRQLFLAAGYTDVEIFEERNKGWICATGRSPGSTNGNRQQAIRTHSVSCGQFFSYFGGGSNFASSIGIFCLTSMYFLVVPR
jgi:hypothetical protein